MLQPRETDLPGLFLVLVVFPLVAYVLLGKWSEASKKKERISLLAQIAAEEAFRAEAMAAATVVPLVSVPKSNNGIHECARCFGPATTRCSRCKSVRYCSGKCQIIHWRQVHKQECQLVGYNSSCGSPMSASNEECVHEQFLFTENLDSQYSESNVERCGHEKAASDDALYSSSAAAFLTEDTAGLVKERRPIDKRSSHKFNREMLRGEESVTLQPSEETCSTSYGNIPSKETFVRHKPKRSHVLPGVEIQEKKKGNTLGDPGSECVASRFSRHESPKPSSPHEDACNLKNNFGFVDSIHSPESGTTSLDMETELMEEWSLPMEGIGSAGETRETRCFPERSPTKKSNTMKLQSHSPGSKMQKSAKSSTKVSRDQRCPEMEKMGQLANELDVSRTRDKDPQAGNGIVNKGFMKIIGLKRASKHDKVERSEVNGDKHKKIKMLFPYEEFVKLFQCAVFDLPPRGLINCGNSCYANAVLQCLTSTKPLTIYFLRRSHSRACCAKKWCLMCELEHHVMMLRESGEPLSLSRILSHMQTANCQIGDGSQEDAHEFLRLIVTKMQSICLEGLGGEDAVDPKSQETTFVQHTFGGKLRSKVKCLGCHHESDRYENIMDLTLEIFGWVESLEDALTQFTSPEDLDGENMYRCGRCAAYVRAQKQLAIQEAPNILTIVLKRFQEGNYGKINKCITFPDMLDMIPFMTGTDDIPPLYVLYGVVVHLDTMNASFSGHYISYVKDLQGNWFRIDDTQVQPAPLSQVMSEGAYILFYMRSAPRPPRSCTEKASRQQASGFAKHWMSKAPKSTSDDGQEMTNFQGVINQNRPVIRESFAKPSSIDFSDVASSDWSVFTSSDDASFTTESTRDSFSTVDYSDNTDPISSIFNTFYTPPDYMSRNTVLCSRFSSSRPHTRFMEEEKRSVLNSYQAGEPPYRLHKVEMVTSSAEAFPTSTHCGLYMKHESDQLDGISRTPAHFTL